MRGASRVITKVLLERCKTSMALKLSMLLERDMRCRQIDFGEDAQVLKALFQRFQRVKGFVPLTVQLMKNGMAALFASDETRLSTSPAGLLAEIT